MLTRRFFLQGLIAAPAIVPAASLMPVQLVPLDWSNEGSFTILYPTFTLDQYSQRILRPTINDITREAARLF